MVLWSALLCVASVNAADTLPTPMDAAGDRAARTLLVLGDSISAGYGIQRDQGWVNQLRQRLEQRAGDWRVVNASVSGETTGGGLARLPDALAEHRPGVVIIELGGNDGLRGYPVSRIRDNLERMVALSQGAGSRVLLVGMQIPPNYGPRYTRDFAAMYPAVAEARGVALVPFLLQAVALEPSLMQDDGIHPTAAAQPRLLETVWPHLEPLLETPPQAPPEQTSKEQTVSMIQSAIETKLAERFQPAHLEVVNESGNHNVPAGSESHFKVVLVAAEFGGKRPLARHRLVNETLREELSGPVHALAIHTYTEDEWRQRFGAAPLSPPCLGGAGGARDGGRTA